MKKRDKSSPVSLRKCSRIANRSSFKQILKQEKSYVNKIRGEIAKLKDIEKVFSNEIPVRKKTILSASIRKMLGKNYVELLRSELSCIDEKMLSIIE